MTSSFEKPQQTTEAPSNEVPQTPLQKLQAEKSAIDAKIVIVKNSVGQDTDVETLPAMIRHRTALREINVKIASLNDIPEFPDVDTEEYRKLFANLPS